jgi:hypothetical protein
MKADTTELMAGRERDELSNAVSEERCRDELGVVALSLPKSQGTMNGWPLKLGLVRLHVKSSPRIP